jgi:hypothetical protein
MHAFTASTVDAILICFALLTENNCALAWLTLLHAGMTFEDNSNAAMRSHHMHAWG